MKKPTRLPTVHQEPSTGAIVIYLIIAAACVAMLLAPWSN